MSTLIEKIKIEIDGDPFDDYNFQHIEWTQEVLKPNEFSFTMQKKDFFKAEEDVSFEIPKYLIGKKVACMIQTQRFDEYAMPQNEELEFEGIIFNVDVSRSELVAEILIHVTAYSPDFLLIDNKHCISYEEKSLQELVEETITPYTFPKKIDPKFTTVIPYSVQYNETNYEYLVRLAKRYGEWLYHDGKEFVFGKLKETPPSIEIYARTDMLSYRYSAKITHDNIEHLTGDYLKHQLDKKHWSMVDTSSGDGVFKKELKQQSQTLFQKPTIQDLQCAIPEENDADDLEESVKAQFLGDKSEITICSGTTVRADLRIGKRFTIKDFYDISDNKTGIYNQEELFVYKITHKCECNGLYENEFSAITGKCVYPPYQTSDIFPKAITQRGEVVDNKDPEKLGRVRVRLNWQIGRELMTPWIRIAQPHGGPNKGFYYIPEIDEDLLIGFVNENAEKPYVIGTVYNGDHRPDSGKWYTDTNDVKAIRTRNGHTIEIHDEGAGGFIKIYDNEKDNYVLTFSTDEKVIKLESKGNIELYAENDIIMNAKHDIKQKAGNARNSSIKYGDTLTGETVTITASSNIITTAGGNINTHADGNISIDAVDISLNASGNMALKAGGRNNINGSTVIIN